MKTKLFTLFIALTCATSLFASDIQVDGIWYYFNSENQTASVTYRGGSYSSYEDEYSGSVVIPETVTYNSVTYSVISIGSSAFYDCSGLTSVTIPNSVSSIGGWAFSGCSGLSSVTIPNSITEIGQAAFQSCSGLTSFTIPNSVTSIEDYVFNGCSGLTSISIHNSITEIGEFAFNGCSGLTSLTIPNSVTEIGRCAFQSCSGLTSITIPNSLTSIGYMTFNCCSGLTSLTIPNSITEIGGGAFSGCSGLTSITIPNSVTTIGSSAFLGCSGLTSVTIPNSVTSIGNYAFSGCSGLTSVTIPNSITEIGGGAFSGCSGLTSITIPNSVTSIGDRAFSGCEGLTSPVYNANCFAYMPEAYSGAYTIPDGIKQIAGSAFFGCSGLTSVTIPNSVTSIGEDAFSFCEGLTSVTVGNSVTTIGDDAFSRCKGLTSITIPYSVTSIGSYAFWSCSSLTSITCCATTPPTCGYDCFRDVNKTIPINVPFHSLETYKQADGWNYFSNFRPDGWYQCGESLLWNYEKSVLTIMGSGEMYDYTRTSIPWKAYQDSITKVTFPTTITSVGNYAFYGMTNLTTVTIPNLVTTIGESAFEDCTYLKTITLGKSLTDIGCNAFKGDFRVEEITSYAEVTPNVCFSTFDGLSKQYIYLYVPENSIRGYQVDPNWNEFDIRTKSADKKPIDGDNPVVTPTDQDVTITWPITDGTDTYTLTITKNGETVCVLTFNTNGQLTNIAFAAPGHNGAHQAPAATLTAQGYQFTVTGLNPGTAYDYSVTATDAGGKTLAEHKGNFSTTGGTGLNTLPYEGKKGIGSKYFHNGNLIIERNGVKYTPAGQKVR